MVAEANQQVAWQTMIGDRVVVEARRTKCLRRRGWMVDVGSDFHLLVTEFPMLQHQGYRRSLLCSMLDVVQLRPACERARRRRLPRITRLRHCQTSDDHHRRTTPSDPMSHPQLLQHFTLQPHHPWPLLLISLRTVSKHSRPFHPANHDDQFLAFHEQTNRMGGVTANIVEANSRT